MSTTKQLKGVILVSFEFPPRRLSKMSDEVEKIAKFLSKEKIKTWVITFDDWRSGIEKINDFLIIHRIPYPVPNNISFLAMIMNLKPAYQSVIASILHSSKIDLIHLFDWTTLPIIIPWKNELKVKTVLSLPNLQILRDSATSPYNQGIKKIELLGMETVTKIIVPSKEVASSIKKHYNINENKITIVSQKEKKFSEKISEIYNEIIV
ncbi:MAG TPA: glycosyltransferase family 4 protein [candidate division Zixibacteria bacterium]|nr:glycosyltransferase family 4 protein [candidate division Zixibacteria bacterium]